MRFPKKPGGDQPRCWEARVPGSSPGRVTLGTESEAGATVETLGIRISQVLGKVALKDLGSAYPSRVPGRGML